jgi:histone H2B
MPPKAEKKPATTVSGATAGKAPATEKKKGGRGGEGAKKKGKRKETFGSYIYKVLKQVKTIPRIFKTFSCPS